MQATDWSHNAAVLQSAVHKTSLGMRQKSSSVAKPFELSSIHLGPHHYGARALSYKTFCV